MGGPHPRELAVKSAVTRRAARFFIDVRDADGRVLRESVRIPADVGRCPSTLMAPTFTKIKRKHHTSLSKGRAGAKPRYEKEILRFTQDDTLKTWIPTLECGE